MFCEEGAKEVGTRISLANGLSRGRTSLAPAFDLLPDLRESAEFRTAADEDRDFFFERVGIVRRCPDIFHVLPEFFEAFAIIVENDHAVAGVTARSP